MSIYTPEHFRSDAPPPRIMGTEMEYVLDLRDKEDALSATGLAALARSLHNGFVDQHFMPNGARVYADCGNVEYATPECLGPREVVCAELAGQLIVEKAAAQWNDGAERLYRRTGGTGGNGDRRSVGYHQNFLTVPYSSLWEQQHDAQVIGAHLASRVIWAGNGSVANRYLLSQKAHDIQRSGQEITIENNFFDGNILRIGEYGNRTRDCMKPLLSWSRAHSGAMESHARGWERLEIRYADANHSPWARSMSMATTSLVLRLLEHKSLLDDEVWQGLRVKQLANTVHEISGDTRFGKQYEMVSGEQLTAVELQRRLAEMAIALSLKVTLPTDELSAAYQWRSVCDDLESYDPRDNETLRLLSDRIEWAARLRAIHRQNQRSGKKLVSRRNIVASCVDQAWDLIFPTSVATKYWRCHQPDFFEKHDSEIKEFMYRPPRLTRAYRRSEALKRGYKIPIGKWDKVQNRNKEILFTDPYDYGD